MKIPRRVVEQLRKNSEMLRLPLEPFHGWRSSPDEGRHTHCECCAKLIYRGDPVVGCYLEFVSTVFCPECVRDNPDVFREWMTAGPS